MQSWFKISLLLCFFGFLKELRPSEPFVTDYLTHPWRNITTEELNKSVFPCGTYSTAVQLIFVLLITDFLRYKPVIVAIGVSGIITWALLVWTTSFEWAIVIEIFYGTYIATEVAYYTYIYAKVDKEHYLTVTSHTRAAILCGKFLSGTLGQALLCTRIMDLRQLHIFTFATQIAATAWSLLLPPVGSSLYFNPESAAPSMPQSSLENDCDSTKKNRRFENVRMRTKLTTAFDIIWLQLKTAFTNSHVQLWSLWYVAGMCGHFQVISYIQMLWFSIDNSPEVIWNGAVEACTTLLAACTALLASRIHANLLSTTKKLWLLVILSLLQGGVIFLGTNTTNRFIAYVGYTLFYIFYTFTITVASAEIAKNIPEDSFGLIFGINTFAGMVFQSLLTVVVVTDAVGLNLNIQQQFNIYACFFVILGTVYLIPIGYRLMKGKRCSSTAVAKQPDAEIEKSIEMFSP